MKILAIQQWYIQLLILLLVLLCLKFIWKKLRIKRPKLIDLVGLLLFVNVHLLSVQLLGLSVVPFIILGLAVFGIFMTLLYAYLEGEIFYRRFFMHFWRIVDLVMIFIYLILLILMLLQVLEIV